MDGLGPSIGHAVHTEPLALHLERVCKTFSAKAVDGLSLRVAPGQLRRSDQIPPALALAPFVAVLATQISASLAWIAVSGEDAPELIQSAPVSGTQATAAKLSAIAAPVAFILAAPMLVLMLQSLSAALTTAVVAVLAGDSAALINFWHPMAGNRRGLLRRHSQSKVVALAEHSLSILWALTAVFALVDPRFVALPAVMIALIISLDGVRLCTHTSPAMHNNCSVRSIRHRLGKSDARACFAG